MLAINPIICFTEPGMSEISTVFNTETKVNELKNFNDAIDHFVADEEVPRIA